MTILKTLVYSEFQESKQDKTTDWEVIKNYLWWNEDLYFLLRIHNGSLLDFSASNDLKIKVAGLELIVVLQ